MKESSVKQCQESTVMTTNIGTEGYLSSYVTQQTGCGNANNPLQLTAVSGQTIRVELVDFAYGRHNGGILFSSHTESDDVVCTIYATIKDASAPVANTVCGNRKMKVSQVFVSTSHSVLVAVIPPRGDKNTAHFLLKYTGTHSVN